jgi:large subunit ribosomal protein L21e
LTNKKAKGKRAKTRNKFHRGANTPRLTVKDFLRDIAVGTTVHIDIDSSVHSGLPHHRYQGLTGQVSGMRGAAMVVDVNLGNQAQQLIIHPAHLKEKKEPKQKAN